MHAGADIAYVVTVGNAGPDSATAATLSATLPAPLRFASITAAPGWSCTPPLVGTNGTVECTDHRDGALPPA